jgi:uncharacterized protein
VSPQLNNKFTEYKRTYFGETKVFECHLAERKANEIVIIYEISAPVRFVGLSFLPRSRSYGYFWTERNYNVYHWIGLDDRTIVFYFNISKDTKILKNSVEWQDLVVDIVAFPDGKTTIIDEDEIPKSMDAVDLAIIEKTKNEIFSNLKEITTEIEIRTSGFIRNFC